MHKRFEQNNMKLPRVLSPRPAEVRISRPTGQRMEGPLLFEDEDEEEEGGDMATEVEHEDTPLFSRPSRNFRASYMLTAFLSTLLTMTDCGAETGGGHT